MKKIALLFSLVFSIVSLQANLLSPDGTNVLQSPTVDTLMIDSTICYGTVFLLPDGNAYDYDSGNNQDTLEILLDQELTTVFLNLEVIVAPETSVNIFACEGETVNIEGQVFIESGEHTIPYPIPGPCDSLVTYLITFIPPIGPIEVEIITCRQEEVGIEEVGLTSIHGCDSIVIYDTVLDTSFAYESYEVYKTCPGDTIILNGVEFTSDTTLVEFFTAQNGCDSTIVSELKFSDIAFETYNDIPTQICQGEDLQIIYGTDFVSLADFPFIRERGDSLALPDGTGAVYTSAIMVDTFPPNTFVESGDQVEVCVNMEHSWMHDLEISIQCPDGTSVQLQNQQFIGDEVFLGVPIDDHEGPYPGIGYTYCWVANAPNGTWTEYTQANQPNTLPAGDYSPRQSFDSLVGCPWNGEWRISITDLWGSDNGFIFFWTIGSRRFGVDSTVVIDQGWDDHPLAEILGDTLNISADEAGIFDFTYALQDSSGCVYDTTFTIEVLPAFFESVDTTLCLGATLYDTPVDTAGSYSFLFTASNGCDSTLQYQVALFPQDTTYLFADTCQLSAVGTFMEVLTSSYGCDSLVITEVNYISPPDTTVDVRYNCTSPQDDEYILLQGANGCDSVVLATYIYEPLNYTVLTQPDTCFQGLGFLDIALLNNPNYTAIDINLFEFNSNQPVGEGTFIDGLTAGFYTLEIQADEHCLIVETVQVENIDQSPTAPEFEYEVMDNQVSFAMTSTPEEADYRWTFGDGSSASGMTTNYSYPYYGAYEACFTAENSCGASESCQDIYLPFELRPQGGEGVQGQQLSLPVRTNGIYQLGDLNFIFNFQSPEVIQFDSISPVAFAGQGNFLHDYSVLGTGESLLSIFWNAQGPPGLTVESSDTLFLIHLTLVGEPGTSTTVTEEYDPQALFYVNNTFSTFYFGEHIDTLIRVIEEPSEITGLVQTAPYHTDPLAPIANVEANLEATGGGITSDMTDASGQYTFTAESGIDYRIFFEKGNDDLNGLTTLGILRLLRHLAGVVPFTNPYQIIAADVDCNEMVNLDDASTLQELLLGNTGIPLCESWVFVPSIYEFPVPTNPFPFPQDYDIPALNQPTFEVPAFYGIKVGDVLGESAPERPVLADSLILTVNNQTALAGDTIELTFSTIGFELLTGFQMELQFDTMMLEWIDAEAMGDLSGYSNADFGLGQIESGLFRNLWFTEDLQPGTMEDGSQLFTIRLKAKADIEEGLEPLVAFFAENLAPEAYDANFERIDLLLRFDMLNAVEAPSIAGLQLFQNQPNPFGTETLIPFYLPQSSEVELIITDALGRLVSRHHKQYATGYHQYTFASTALPSGVYYYTLRTSYGWATKKMIFAK